jgi:circadian clock protein KaiC
MLRQGASANSHTALAKVRTGIEGLDEITEGGLPAGRPTLICGGAGCGKTILAMEFLVHGAREFNQPGLFLSFEESPTQILENFRSFGFHLEDLVEEKKLKISHVELGQGKTIESGAFTLEGLLIRVEQGIAAIGVKRVVLDSMDALFSALANTQNLRNEIARMLQALRDRQVSVVVTAERGADEFSRYGFQEYVSDCVLLLDHRISGQISKRRVRIVKYRGSRHSADEFPFLIGRTGISVLPITSVSLDHGASNERVSSGVDDLDEMLGGSGYFKGSTVLVTGQAGTGKSSLASAFAVAVCKRSERCLYFSFEESAAQKTRNMKSIGIDLEAWLQRGLLTIEAFRPSHRGLEEHLVALADRTEAIEPTCVIMDPITDFISVGDVLEIKSMLTRILDFLKHRGITMLMTALTPGSSDQDQTEMRLSSLSDTWIAVNRAGAGASRLSGLQVVKSRGMQHSQEVRRLVMSSRGLSLTDQGGDSHESRPIA